MIQNKPEKPPIKHPEGKLIPNFNIKHPKNGEKPQIALLDADITARLSLSVLELWGILRYKSLNKWAGEMNLSRSYLTNLLHGTQKPIKSDIYHKIAETLDIDVYWVIKTFQKLKGGKDD